MSKKVFPPIAVLLLPLFAHAQTVLTVIDNIISIFQMLIPMFVSIAVLMFFWGVVKFMAHADDEHAVEEGKMYMVWGLVGVFIIVSMWGIVGFIQHSLIPNVYGGLGNAPNIPISVPVP